MIIVFSPLLLSYFYVSVSDEMGWGQPACQEEQKMSGKTRRIVMPM
jgi:hypothetical protein